jgi:predicted P-loop ATPase
MIELNTISCYKEAFRLMADGKSVMPVGKDKKPLLKSWKFLQERIPTEEELEEWWTRWPEANVGLITGRVSGITVLDLDVGHETSTPVNTFPETLTQSTPSGGTHLIYLYTPGFSVSANQYPQYPYLDMRSDGGFIVYAPSVTPRGEYRIIKNISPTPFPVDMFPKNKIKRSLSSVIGVKDGTRDSSLTSFAGKLLQAESDESKWYTEVLPAVERANMTYNPPLSDDDVLKVFNSISQKEKIRREGLILSPIQMDTGEVIKDIKIPIRKNGNVIIKDMANAVIVLEHHPYYKGTIKYNTFRQEIEYNGRPLEDSDVIKIQHFMQTEAGLSGIQQGNVFSAIVHYAQKNKYDEAQEWLTAQVWDQVPRLSTWISSATGIPTDKYHSAIGMQWFNGMISRIMKPGSIFDYMLVLTGSQGLGKTSLFRIIGGPWYKSYTGTMDSKDFYLALRGAIIIDLDEGATLYKSEAIKIKSIITETHDEFRAPYDRIMKKYPRRFVFSMSTNDAEPFRDVTGNRRYWAIDIKQSVNFKWLEENRDQLFAEAYYYYKNKIDIAEVPQDEALAIQEAHLPDDSWTELVVDEVRKSPEYCAGDPNYTTTIIEVFQNIFKNESLVRLDKRHEMRIGTIFRKQLGLEKKQMMFEGERKNRYYITEKKMKELQARNAKKTVTPLEDLVDELEDDAPVF